MNLKQSMCNCTVHAFSNRHLEGQKHNQMGHICRRVVWATRYFFKQKTKQTDKRKKTSCFDFAKEFP